VRQGSDFGIPNPTQQIEVRIELDPIAEQRSRQGIESLGSQLRAVAESLQPFDTRADLTPQTGQRAVLTPHHVVAQRAQASIGRLDERLAQAKADGLMTFFNSQYRARRARAAGEPFPPFRAGSRACAATLDEAKAAFRAAWERRH